VKKIFTILSLAILSVTGAKAQDTHFSQFFEAAALRNPALVGIFSGDYKVGVNYRSQWGEFGVPFQTAVVNAEAKVLLRDATKDYLSFGLATVYDKAGSLSLNSMSAFGSVNYNKALGMESKTYLSVGLCGGYIQRSFDITKARTASQYGNGSYDPNASTNENLTSATLRHFDASAGISLSGAMSPSTNYYVGFAGYHVSRPQESFFEESMIRLTTRWTASAGLSARLGDGYGLTAHFNYQRQAPYQETIGGLLLSRSFRSTTDGQEMRLSAGCFYRLQDAFIPMMKVEYKNWALTMSYDMTTGSQRMYMSGFGGYECSLSIRGMFRHREPDALACPRFEMLQDATYQY
jgi:type IX secretion system PorP/SprF family membrane protein